MPFIVLSVGLVATLLVLLGFRSAAKERDAERFRHWVQHTHYLIQNRLDTYNAVLLSTRGMFESQGPITLQEFRQYVKHLELDRLYPGIQGIGLSIRLDPDDRGRVEQELQQQGIEEFRVWPTPEEREELHTIVYLEPLDQRNRAALGFDMSTEPVRHEAMIRARDTGLPAASGRVILVQEISTEVQPGFLIYVPIYEPGTQPTTEEARREHLVGFVYSPFRMEDLLAGVFSRERPWVSFSIHDGETPDEESLLFASPSLDDSHQFIRQESLRFAGRTWTLVFKSQPRFESASDDRLLPYIGVAGVVLSVVLFLLSGQQARAQERLRLHMRVLESMTEGVSVADEHGTIVYTNAAEDRIFGYERGELLGQSVTVQNADPPEENQRRVREVIDELRHHGVWSGEFDNVKKDGTPFITAARISALEIGGRLYWVCVQEDITERKRVEEERRRLLEREHHARAEAEAANRAKDEFLAMLGHELRNPLAPIVTALQLLELKENGDLSREHRVIQRHVQHLSRLVDDLLDVSRITRGRVELNRKQVDVRELLARAAEMASPLLEQRHHHLTLEPGDEALFVSGDELRLAQVFSNLLTNAAKYTEPGGYITVAARREGESVIVEVHDTGVGIAPELLPKVFDLFTQAERSIERSQGGLGIGLTLVKRLVEAHGGEVEAHSDGLGHGSRFVVRLPGCANAGVASLEQVLRRKTPKAAPAVAAPKLLVVDDNEDAAELIAELLRSHGYEVAVAHDGPEALERAHREPPTLAVLDIGLPVMDGIELGTRLRALRPTILIAVSGYGQAVDRARTKAAGFASHHVKPVDFGELLATIEGLLATREPEERADPLSAERTH